MISIRREPAVIISGCELTAVARISLEKYSQNGRWMFVGDKRPIAIICRTEYGEHIFDMEGRQIDAVELEKLVTTQHA